MNNHNKLLGKVEGLDGIKTGFICASGFNIATSAVRDGRRLIAVVMGGETASARDKKVTRLIDQGFDKLGVQAPAADEPQNLPNLTQVSFEQNSNSDVASEEAPPRGLQKTAQKQTAFAPGNWGIQIGAYRQSKDAQVAAKRAKGALSVDLLRISVTKAPRKQGKLYRSRLMGCTYKSAQKACKVLKSRGIDCMPVQNDASQKLLTAMNGS